MPQWSCSRYSRDCLHRTALVRLRHSAFKRRIFPSLAFLSATDTKNVLREFADAGLAGGGLYDGLVGVAARKHQLPLITCDRRAEPTYRVLGVNYELLEPISR